LSLFDIEGEFNLYGKSPEVVDEWRSGKVDPRIILRVRILAAHLAHLSVPCVLTDLLRNDPGSVHSVGRGADCRITCSMEEAEQLRAWFNHAFPYDSARPTLETIVPLDHGSAPHFHIQVKQ
jgi:hypothetical protein